MDDYQVSDHFVGKTPEVRAIYDTLVSALRQNGEVHESAKKTSIHLDHKTGFAGVYTLKNGINLNFRLSHQLDHARITKIEQHSARRYMHTVKLQSPTDVDAELLAWLKEAYELAR